MKINLFVVGGVYEVVSSRGELRGGTGVPKVDREKVVVCPTAVGVDLYYSFPSGTDDQ